METSQTPVTSLSTHWYLVHTKPRQEHRALLNLEQQGFECYLPMLQAEKIRQGNLSIVAEPLFPRYLFIHLDTCGSARSWEPIRFTKGVSRLVTFGAEPAKVDRRLVEALRIRENAFKDQPLRLFHPGDHVLITNGPFHGIEAVYQMSSGEERALVLLELLNHPASLRIPTASLRRIR